MKFQLVTVSFATIAFVVISPLASANPAQDLEECRSISVESERLSCFDAAYDQLRAAGMTPDSVLKSNIVEIAVPAPASQSADKAAKTVGPVKRFFGFGLSEATTEPEDFGLKNDAVTRNEIGGVEQITTRITEVSRSLRGNLIVKLANGQRWRQTDGRRTRVKEDEPVVISRGALGSYKMNIGGNRFIRVTRIDDGSNIPDADAAESLQAAPVTDVKPEKKGGLFSRIGRRIGLGKKVVKEETVSPIPTEASGEETGISVTRSVSMVMVDPENRFIITLRNGQVWQQIAGVLKVRDGDSVTIRPAKTGGYVLKVGDQGTEVPVQLVN